MFLVAAITTISPSPAITADPENDAVQSDVQAENLLPSDTSTMKPDQGAQEIGPEIYYVPDKDGRLRAAVLNEITFDEFKIMDPFAK